MIRDRDRDDRDRDERPKRSWREIDQMRDGTGRRDEREPRGPAAEARARAAAQENLKQADALFSSGPGGAEGARLIQAVRDAHGTPEFSEACRAYLEAAGPPTKDAALAAMLLDAEDRDVLVAGLDALTARKASGELTLNPGLRTRLRMLTEHSDDDVAYAAEELLE